MNAANLNAADVMVLDNHARGLPIKMVIIIREILLSMDAMAINLADSIYN